MAKIKVKFNNKDYQIEESAFAPAGEKVVTHLTGEMKGTGATVKFGGNAYDVDSTKLSSSAAALAAYLGTIVGSGVKIVIGGVEYGVNAAKVAGAVTGVETTLVGMSGTVEPDIPEVNGSQGLEYVSKSDGTCDVMSIGTCTDNDVVIPSVSPSGESVTGITDMAFDGCVTITSITIPNSVTTIGFNTFYGCTSLASIIYGGTIAEWKTIKKSGGWDDDTPDYIIHCVDGDITKDGEVITPEEELPASEGLEFASNGDGTCYVSGIGTCADTEIVIPSTEGNEQVTAIGYCAFFMSSITGVTIPDSVTSIGYQAFSVCESLTDVVIPESVTTIGEMAFENCISLKSVTIGKGIKFIDSMAFAFAESLEDMYYSGTMAEWNAIEKADDWDEPIRSEGYTIHCADGDIVRKYN